MVQDVMGIGAAVSGVADEVSEVIDSMDRPIWTQVTTTKKGKTVTKTVWAVSKLDVLLFMVIGISAAIVFISLVESMGQANEGFYTGYGREMTPEEKKAADPVRYFREGGT